MQSYYFLLVTALLPLSHGHAANSPYLTFAKCNNHLISTIKTHWAVTGVPQNVLETFEPGVKYYALHTSYDMNFYAKCAYAEFTDKEMKITLIPNDNGPKAYVHYSVEQTNDGHIVGAPLNETATEELKWKWYTVFKGNGVVINYVCSENSGSTEKPLTVFWVSKKSYSNVIIKTAINAVLNFMKSLGFKFTYSYGEECLSSTSTDVNSEIKNE